MIKAWYQSQLYFLLSRAFYTLSPARNFKAVFSSSSPYTQAGLPSVCCVVIGARGELLVFSMTS